MAIAGLSKCATDELEWVGLFHLEKIFQESFCVPDSPMTRANDFSDRTQFLLQCAIPQAIARIRTNSDQAPMTVKKFFVDKLKFNDNTDNGFSDVHYVSILMSGLADSLISPKDAMLDDEDEAELTFRKTAINEIERYRRIDEWASSYQNIYSITALDCLKRLAQFDVMKPSLREFLQYTRPGNGDGLRLKAIECLVDLGLLKNDAILKYFLHLLSSDPSPYFREHAFQIFGKGLGSLAVGENNQDIEAPPTAGLIIAQEGSTEARQAELARRQTIPGALAALKTELGENTILKQALWAAVTSPIITLDEMSNLLDICAAIYDSKTSLMVVLKYPHHWQAEHIGKAVMRFSRSARVRTTQHVPFKWLEPAPIVSPIAKSTIVLPPTPSVVKPLKVALPKASVAATPKAPATIKRKHSAAEADTVKPKMLLQANSITLGPSSPALIPAAAPLSTPKPAPSHDPPRRSHILKLKFKGPLPPNPPAKYAGTKPSKGAGHANGNGLLRLTTPLHGILKSPSPVPPQSHTAKSSKKAMSPPTRPASTSSLSTASHAHKQKTKTATPLPPPTSQHHTSTVLAGSPPAPAPTKKRKNTITPLLPSAEQPPAKKPILKIRLSGVGSANGGGSAGSPGPG